MFSLFVPIQPQTLMCFFEVLWATSKIKSVKGAKKTLNMGYILVKQD